MTIRWIRGFVFLAAGIAASAQTEAPNPPAAREPGLYATISTSMGDIVARLYEKESPVTVKNFVDLAHGRKYYLDPRTRQKSNKPLYNGLTFHRVIPGFMIQTGDPLGNGTGGTESIPEERNPSLKFDKPGRLGMANAGLNTGSSQFFITEVPTPHLDDLHTIFGQVIEGQSVVEKIARVDRDARSKPLKPVRLISVSVKREGPGAPVAAPKPAGAKKPVTGVKKPAAAKPKTPAVKKPAAVKPKTEAPK